LRETIRGVDVERLAYPKVPLLGALWLIAKFSLWLLRHRRSFDAVHIHMARNLAAGAGLVQRWLRGPVMVKISGAWEFDGGVLDPTLQHKPLIALLNRCIRKVAYVQAISAKTRGKLLAAGYPDTQIQMIPNAVDVARFDAEPIGTAPVGAPVRVIFVGRLQPVKGPVVLIDAWRRVAACTNARLTLVGDGPLRAELERMVGDYGLSASVEFAGRSTQVPALLRQADICVQPSFQEGLPNAVLEAMTAGLPIVATRVSGNEDLVVEGVNGLLVEAGHAEELAAALLRVIGDRALAERMGRASRIAIDAQYSSVRVLDLLERAYRGNHVSFVPKADAA
jgi:L-malate glycosyltransferase